MATLNLGNLAYRYVALVVPPGVVNVGQYICNLFIAQGLLGHNTIVFLTIDRNFTCFPIEYNIDGTIYIFIQIIWIGQGWKGIRYTFSVGLVTCKAGIGIDLESQTLPTDSLNLNTKEIQDIIAFMKTLEDE